MHAGSTIITQLHVFVVECHVLFEFDPFREFLHQRRAQESGYHHNEQSDCPDKLFMLSIDLQAQSKSNGPSHHPRIPTNFQLLAVQFYFLAEELVEHWHCEYHYCSDHRQTQQHQSCHKHGQPVPVDTQSRSPQIRKDECLGDVAYRLEGKSGSSLRLLGDIHVRIMTHDDRAGEEGDDTRKAHHLAHKISNVAIEQNKACLFDRVLVNRLIHLEKVAEAEPADGPKRHTEKEQIAEIEEHLLNNFIPKFRYMYVNSPPV